MWKLLQRFNALDKGAQRLFLCATVLMPMISASLRLCGLRATQATLGRFLLTGANLHDRTKGNRAKDAARIAHMVHAAARYGLVRPTCLESSLALWWFLGRQGIESSLRIGTRKIASGLEAHAWVEFGGSALDETGGTPSDYAPFDALFPVVSRR
jgi:Transglutaminase-like superfamily